MDESARVEGHGVRCSLDRDSSKKHNVSANSPVYESASGAAAQIDDTPLRLLASRPSCYRVHGVSEPMWIPTSDRR